MSPDTCLALIALRKRLLKQEMPDNWREHADQWEQGYNPCPVLERNFAALLGAHVHASIELNEEGSAVFAGRYQELLTDCVDFASALIEAGCEPCDIDCSKTDLGPSVLKTHHAAVAAC